MKRNTFRALIILLSAISIRGNSQGFATVASNWTLPSGGYIDVTHLTGFDDIFNTGADYNNCQGWSTMDMNGDGKPDLVVTSQGNGSYKDCFGVGSSPIWKVYLNTGSAMSASATNWTLPTGGYIDVVHLNGFNATFETGSSYNNCQGWSTLDMNGDGKPDLVVTSQGDGTHKDCFNVSSSQYWKVYLNTGTGFSTSSTNWTLPAGGYISSSHLYGFNDIASTGSTETGSQCWSVADMNGDGKPDLVVSSQGDGTNRDCYGVGSSPHWKVYLNNGSGFSTSASNWTLPSGGYVDYNAHLNGFESMNNVGADYVGSLCWSTIDMNGDSKPDLVVNTIGNGTTEDCFGVGSSPYWKVYLNSGSGFSTSASNWSLPAGGYVDYNSHLTGFDAISNTGADYLGSQCWSTIDINGDHKPDLVVNTVGNGTTEDCFGVGSSPHWLVYLNTGSAMSSSAINWTLPSGGYVDYNGHLTGFDAIENVGADYVGAQCWSTLDMNGDGKVDLCVNTQGDGTHEDCFGVGSGPYWKVYLNTTSTGLEQTENELNSISVYPNPFVSSFTVTSSGEKKSSIEICNCLGQIVYQSETQNQTIEIDLSTLQNGIYFLKFTSGENSMTKKIIKE